MLPDAFRFSDAASAWTSLHCRELTSVKVIDVYELEATKSVTVRFTFSSEDKTLSMEEIQPVIDAVISNLGHNGILLRA